MNRTNESDDLPPSVWPDDAAQFGADMSFAPPVRDDPEFDPASPTPPPPPPPLLAARGVIGGGGGGGSLSTSNIAALPALY